jgi:class 3 adenylate cyclase
MALVFYKSPEEPVECALEISRALKEHPKLQLRMGAHSGPVSGVIDVNGQANLAGAGLNTAQRVMACGDAGHILLSRHVAEDLALTNMALGDKATALALLERTMAAVPIEKDALNGPGPIEILARVAAQMGGTRPRHRRFTKATLDTVHWRAG